MPTPLPQISSLAWEHPADRVALDTLRTIPGFDEIVRQVASFLTERRIRQMFLANAVQVSQAQRPKLHALLTDVLVTMDWPKRPALYVTQSPTVNAYAIGFDDPFIVVTSGALDLLESDDERRFMLAHELGHIMSDHMTYRTIATVILVVGSLAIMPVGLALLPFHLGLLEWHRKSEFSSDRAALLALQDRVVAQRTFMHLAGGRDIGDATSVDAFMEQAAKYETSGDKWNNILKVFNTAFREHPFNTVRAAELERWRTSGGYDAIVAGRYTRRGERGQKLDADLSDAARYYSDKARSGMSSVGDAFDRAKNAFDRAKNAFDEAFRGRDESSAPTAEPTPPI
jgi:Zn-dependent protease with chaperone function